MGIIRFLILLGLAAGIFGTAGYFIYELYVKPHQLDRAEALAPPPTPPPDPSLAIYERILAASQSAPPVETRQALQTFLKDSPDSPRAPEARQLLGRLNAEALFAGEGATPYAVSKGDSLARIASRQNSSAELLYVFNNLESLRLQIGQQLHIPQLDMRMEIDQVAGTLTLYNRGEFFKEYTLLSAKSTARHATPKQTTVREKFALKGSKRVAFGEKLYPESERWIILGSGDSLRAAPSEPDAPPAGGLAVAPADLREIFLLVRPGTPVTLH